MKIQLQSTEFKTLSVGILDQIKLYNIEWCKILTYPYSSSNKFGGWVAENFLAFTRIGPWFYSLLYELKESKKNIGGVHVLLYIINETCILMID